MIEIKFRAFVKSKNKIIDVFGFNENYVFESTYDTVEIGVNVFERADVELLQYTGFKDKKEKYIYDGDILGDWELVDGKKVQSRMQVFFDEKLGQWMLDCSLKQDKSISYVLFKELEDFEYEVIGNIYEK